MQKLTIPLAWAACLLALAGCGAIADDAVSLCSGPNPAGCSQTGCPSGLKCDTNAGCMASRCVCTKRGWTCDNDCGGGVCVDPGNTPNPGRCTTPNPAGCVQTGCTGGLMCDQNVGCRSSSCTCDTERGTWSCTDDCGGGMCVKPGDGGVVLPCTGPSRMGCVQTGCTNGLVCDRTAGCMSSHCECNGETGLWVCDDDCDGGICVDPGTQPGVCPTPNPAGCVMTGCAPGLECDPKQGCTSSYCECSKTFGGWICTDDCGGGVCVPSTVCKTPNPAGCTQLGCPKGMVCDTKQGCTSSYCECSKTMATWLCTPDCGGGVCVAM